MHMVAEQVTFDGLETLLGISVIFLQTHKNAKVISVVCFI